MTECPVCGHDAHEPGKCQEWGIIPGCICFCCNGGCTCDGKSWEYDDSIENVMVGGRFVSPDRKLKSE